MVQMVFVFLEREATQTKIVRIVSPHPWQALVYADPHPCTTNKAITNKFIATQPFQCIIVGITHGCARLRFEFIIHNHHHTLMDLESWVTTTLAPVPHFSHQDARWSMFGLILQFHSISTLPNSHYNYNEWLGKVEIGMWALKWSLQGDFEMLVGSSRLGTCPLSTPRLGEFGLVQQITAA